MNIKTKSIAKKFYTLLLVLLGGFALHAQNCDKYIITAKYDNFDSITANYKRILLKDVGQEATSLPSFFKDMATCWLDRVMDFEVFKNYSIREEDKINYPETVFLVFNSRSLSTKEEKQNWFNLMPMMDEEQMAKLFDILEREILKINAIKLRDMKEEQEMRDLYNIYECGMVTNPSDTILSYLGSVAIIDDETRETKYEVDYWKWNEERYVNKNGDAVESITLIFPDDVSKIRSKITNNRKFVISNYEYVIYSYLMNLKKGKGIFPTNEKLQDYVMEWWLYLMEKYHENTSRIIECKELAEIPMEDIFIGEENKNMSLLIRHSCLFHLSLKSGEYGKAADCLSVMINNINDTPANLTNFLGFLFVPVLCDGNDSWEFSRKALEKSLINWYDYVKTKHSYLENAIMVSDYYLHYGNNEDLETLVKASNDEYKDQHVSFQRNHEEVPLRYGDFVDDYWWEFLNKSYSDTVFGMDYKYEDLEKKMMENHFEVNDERMVEYACYYCLYQMINNTQPDRSNIGFILQEIQRICDNPFSDAYYSIEQYIAKDLEKRLKQVEIYKKPSIIFTSPIPTMAPLVYETTEENIELSFSVSSISGNTFDAKFYADTIYFKDKFAELSEQTDRAWVFKKTIRLEPGENVFWIEYEDATNRQYCDTLRIIYAPDGCTVRKDVAVLIAVNDYNLDTIGFKPLTNPIKEAGQLAEQLYEFGFDTVIIRNPDQQKIIKTLEKYALEDYGIYDQLLVFFTGHGTYNTVTKRGFIVPSDGESGKPWRTMVSYEDIKGYLDNSNCNHVLFISDACHSGSFITETKGELPKGNQCDIMNIKSRYFIGTVSATELSPGESKLVERLLQVFKNTDKDVIDVFYIRSAIEVGLMGPWGSNEFNSNFYFNRRKTK